MKRLLVVLGLLLAAGVLYAETAFNSASVTATSQYVRFPSPRAAVTICNASASANTLYFRLFNESDTLGAATTSNAPLAVGACLSFSKAPTQADYFTALALVCDTAQTATAYVYSE